MNEAKTAAEKAAILIEALPYIKKFHGHTVVIKYGGNAMVSEELKSKVIEDIVLMKLVGIKVIVVHGGGPEINAMLKKLDIKSQFINGLRVTDENVMEVVEMVLAGRVNKSIVNLLNRQGAQAVGICGEDGQLLRVDKQFTTCLDDEGNEIPCDLGYVGSVKEVNAGLLEMLLDGGYLPVISPIGTDESGQIYNINADSAAGEIAAAMRAEKLVLLTDVAGLYADFSDPESIISHIDAAGVEEMLGSGAIAGGMIPKVNCCLDALRGGVRSAHILDGRQPHSLLLEIFTNKGIGTMVELQEGEK